MNASEGAIPPNIRALAWGADQQLYASAASSRAGGHLYRLRSPLSR